MLEYFDSVERQLVKIREQQLTGKELAHAGGIALGLTHRRRAPGNAVSDWLAVRNEFQLALLVTQQLKEEKGNTNPTSACGFVAAAVGTSASTVERYYRRHRATIEELDFRTPR